MPNDHDPSLTLLQDFDPRTYLRLLVAQSHLDGLKPEERNYIQARATVLGLDPEGLLAEPLTELPPVPETVSETTRRVIVRDCILLGCIDGDYSEMERAHVHRVAKWLSVDLDAVDRIEDWLRRYWDLMEESEALLSGFDAP